MVSRTARSRIQVINQNLMCVTEAQVIKNHRSQTSIACRGLMAKHRWAISATPILNEIPELYPYFKFLRVPHTGSYAIFKQNFCIPGSNVCNQRLHSFLDQILIRRTYKSQLFELPIIEMPATHQETITLEFNPVERKIYDIIHKRFIKAINKWVLSCNALIMLLSKCRVLAEGNLEKHSRLVLVSAKPRQIASKSSYHDYIKVFTDLNNAWLVYAPTPAPDDRPHIHASGNNGKMV